VSAYLASPANTKCVVCREPIGNRLESWVTARGTGTLRIHSGHCEAVFLESERTGQIVGFPMPADLVHKFE
jgi:hypothetical protein